MMMMEQYRVDAERVRPGEDSARGRVHRQVLVSCQNRGAEATNRRFCYPHLALI